MKNRTFLQGLLLSLCLLVLLPGTAPAFDSPLTGDARTAAEKFGAMYNPLATKFGCPDLAWADISNAAALSLQYLPEGETLETWTRMMTVTIYPLKGKQQKLQEVLTSLQNNLEAMFKANTKVLATNYYKNASGEPALYIEYEVGTGAQKEHGAGVFLHSAKITAAFIQVQERNGKAPGAGDIQKLKDLAAHAKPAR